MAIYRPLIRGYCRRKGLQGADADEVVQEVMLQIHRVIAQFDYRPEQGRFRHWLGVLTHHKLYDFRKKRSGETRSGGQPSGDAPLDPVADAIPDAEWTEVFTRHLLDTALAGIRSHFEEPTWRAF